MPELTPDDLVLLADILGQTDAVFAPVRSWGCGSASNAWFARREYREAGLRWAGGALTAAARKDRQRWLETAADRFLLERPAAAGPYSVRVRLAEPAELAVRRACGLPGLFGTVLLCRELAEYEPGAWVAETPHLGPAGHRRTVEEMAIPGLLRGWVEAASTVRGLVCYRLAVDPDDLPDVAEADDRGEYVRAAREAWAAGLRSRLAALAERDETTARELGAVPLAASRPAAVKRSAVGKR